MHSLSFVPLFWTLLLLKTGSANGQCNEPPAYILPNNSTGNLAFPEANLDLITGSWNSDQIYPPSVSCTWVILAPPLHVLYVKFLQFSTEENFDFVTLYPSLERHEKLFHFSGNLQEDWEAVTPGNTLVVDFFSDEVTSYQGFHLAYRYMPQACMSKNVVVDEPQLIAMPPWNLQGVLPGPVREGFQAPVTEIEDGSPPSPRWIDISTYPQGFNCTWHIEVSPKQLLQIDVLKFHTDPDDILQVWQIEGQNQRPLLKYWNDQIPKERIHSALPVLLNFATIASGLETGGSGFLLNVTYLSRACSSEPQDLLSPRGLIAYPSGNLVEGSWQQNDAMFYGPDSCEWKLRAPDGYSFNVTILQFDTRPEDQLVIFDGEKKVFKHGGNPPTKKTLVSSSNSVIIKFDSNANSKRTGFLLHYSWILKNCEHNLEASEGELRSPFYPATYGDGTRCKWTFNAMPGQVIHLLLSRLKLDQGDYLQITDRNQTMFLTKTSPKTRIMEFRPISPLEVIFHSDKTLNKGYFLLRYNVFDLGSCNFSLTSCGWTQPKTPLVWNVREEEGLLAAKEENAIGMQLPRGYESQLISPLIEPSLLPSSDEHSTKALKQNPLPVCFRVKYYLTGQDAYKLTFTAIEQTIGDVSATTPEHDEKPLLSVHGPHGEYFITGAVNFTVNNPFKIVVNYMRGYGPHYHVGLEEISLTSGTCGNGETALSSFSCVFLKTFCGWKNTHMDDQNWQLDETGISAMITEKIGLSSNKKARRIRKQSADLFSPIVNSKDYENDQDEKLCLSLSYEIHSNSAELNVLLLPVKNVKTGIGSEIKLWSAGRVKSEDVQDANILISLDNIGKEFQIVLRGVSNSKGNSLTNNNNWNEVGATVRKIDLRSGACPLINYCSFDNGFCSWSVTYSGATTWKILKFSDERNNSVAAVVSNGERTDTAQMISPAMNWGEKAMLLSFRYNIASTKQCLAVAVATSSTNQEGDSFTNAKPAKRVIWEQCRGKGMHWLQECVNLPLSQEKYQIIFESGTAGADSKLWIDDIRIESGRCMITQFQTEPAKSLDQVPYWKCDPSVSLCGMSQPHGGSWDWIFVQTEVPGETEDAMNIKVNDAAGDAFICSSGEVIDISARCDGFADCSTEEDELHCEGLKDSFVCVNGDVLNIKSKCDGYPDCIGAEDEFHCDHDYSNEGFICEEGSFHCPSGLACSSGACPKPQNPCLPHNLVCDGHPHCLHGEDEKASCDIPRHPMSYSEMGYLSDQIPHLNFAHPKDDMLSFGSRMECSGGLFIPQSFRCDARKDCPMDGLDEVGCLHCDANDYLCPVSGVCLHMSIVCDGEVSVSTCTDEDDCFACPPGHFACDVCIQSNQICDGVWDCEKGEDETRCNIQPAHMKTTNGDNGGSYDMTRSQNYNEDSRFKCVENEFRCPTGRCIPMTAVCNRKIDCSNEEDELNCPDDNLEETNFISAKNSAVSRPGNAVDSSSYLITPVIHHLTGANGLLSFKYRLDSWLGASNVTLSVEMVHPNDSSFSLLPWALWRQSGNTGRFWLSDHVVIPDIDNLDSFRLAFIITGSSSKHNSEQFHLAKITYRMLKKKSLVELGFARSLCDFGSSWCGWTQPYTERGYSWVHTERSPHARRTGPITGYPDGGSSGFIYADSLFGEEGDDADLLSPPLALPSPESALCFRFAVFLYGAHVAKLSVHAYQPTSGKPHVAELFSAAGPKGLSWVPVSVPVTKIALRNPSNPFLLIIRATKGSGSEGDIALDQISLLLGECMDAKINSDLILSPATDPSSSFINSLKAGPALTKHAINTGLSLPSAGVPDEQRNISINSDHCVLLKSCSECVTGADYRCSWCQPSNTCANELSEEARKCSKYETIFHNSTNEVQAGPSWCPRMIPTDDHRIFVPNHSSQLLSFAVTNIPVRDITSDWTCLYSFEEEDHASNGRSAGSAALADSSLLSQDLLMLKELSESYGDADLWNKLKGFGLDDNEETHSVSTIKVQGRFQGSVYGSGKDKASGMGIGAIQCGDGETLLNLPPNTPVAPVKVSLISPSGNKLDNLDDVSLRLYHCPSLGNDCVSCMSLNTSYSCGWCPTSQQCIIHDQCKGELWHSHANADKDICAIQQQLDFLSNMIHEEEAEEFAEYSPLRPIMEEEVPSHDTTNLDIFTKPKRKVKKHMKKDLGTLHGEGETKRESRRKKGRSKVRTGKNGSKGSGKIGKKSKSRGFLRVPTEEGVFVARDVWRLHTGRQYYIPVKKKTLINLGFVRQVTFGSLAEEKARTILVDGAWKKAAGYYIDLYEKADQDPVTSVVTTSKKIFDQLIAQLQPV